jgi:hypothetical protein
MSGISGKEFMLIKLIWIKAKNEWHMLNDEDCFIQEFYDCGTIHNYFADLDKEKVNLYRVDINKINNQ